MAQVIFKILFLAVVFFPHFQPISAASSSDKASCATALSVPSEIGKAINIAKEHNIRYVVLRRDTGEHVLILGESHTNHPRTFIAFYEAVRQFDLRGVEGANERNYGILVRPFFYLLQFQRAQERNFFGTGSSLGLALFPKENVLSAERWIKALILNFASASMKPGEERTIDAAKSWRRIKPLIEDAINTEILPFSLEEIRRNWFAQFDENKKMILSKEQCNNGSTECIHLEREMVPNGFDKLSLALLMSWDIGVYGTLLSIAYHVFTLELPSIPVAALWGSLLFGVRHFCRLLERWDERREAHMAAEIDKTVGLNRHTMINQTGSFHTYRIANLLTAKGRYRVALTSETPTER